MAKRKSADSNAIEPVAAADVTKRTKSPASKPKSPAATHKRATKKPVVTEEVPVVASAAVPMAAPAAVEIQAKPKHAPTHQEIARLAYSYWEARGYQGGSSEDDWYRAEREISELA